MQSLRVTSSIELRIKLEVMFNWRRLTAVLLLALSVLAQTSAAAFVPLGLVGCNAPGQSQVEGSLASIYGQRFRQRSISFEESQNTHGHCHACHAANCCSELLCFGAVLPSKDTFVGPSVYLGRALLTHAANPQASFLTGGIERPPRPFDL